MMRSLLRHDYEVSMSDTVAMDGVTDTFERESLAHASAEPLGDDDNSLCDVVGKIGKVIDVCFRDYQAFARRRWLQRHECGDDVVLVDEARGGLPRYDIAENTFHD